MAESDAAIDDYCLTDTRLYVAELVGGPSRIRVYASRRPGGGNTFDPAGLLGRRDDPGRRGCDPLREPERPGSAGLVSREPGRTGHEHEPRSKVSGRLLRLRGRPGVGGLARRDSGPDRHPAPQGARSSTERTRRSSTATAVTASASGRSTRRCGASGSNRAASSPSRTCAAAASSATAGTGTATSRESRTCSTTSPPARSAWSKRATRSRRAWRSKAARTAACSWARRSRSTPTSSAPWSPTSGSTTCCASSSHRTGSSTSPSSGRSRRPTQFRALYAYSPYHRVLDRVAYPPVLFLTGANDPRVDPMQSRKMTARLRAAGAPNGLRAAAHERLVGTRHRKLSRRKDLAGSRRLRLPVREPGGHVPGAVTAALRAARADPDQGTGVPEGGSGPSRRVPSGLSGPGPQM